MTRKLRYGMRLGCVFYPLGTEVEVLPANHELLKPLTYIFENMKGTSIMVAVQLPGRNYATLLHSTELKD